MTWSGQQEEALRKVKAWMKEKDQQLCRLFGFAGTGKTTLAKEVAEHVDGKVLFAAFTGKAASVMRQKGCRGASTIHSLIYKLDEEKAGQQPEFILNEDSEVANAKLVIIDECSMVDEKIAKDLLSFGTKILVLGDPAQLPPVSGAGYFTDAEPDIMLTEVHRQARDNPIIALSMKIRAGERLLPGEYGGSKIITRAQLQQEEVLSTDQIIVGKNQTRQLYNERVRAIKKYNPQRPEEGERLVCLRNDRQKGIFNGTLWNIDKVMFKEMAASIKMVVSSADEEGLDPRKVYVRREFFQGLEAKIPWQEKKGTQEFTYGYALTCHKAQGSQWNNILVFNESAIFREDAQRWLYTAVTRAAERLTLVN